MHVMALFSRPAPDAVDVRDRDYLLTGCPIVAQDDQVVLVDLTVRLAVRQAGPDDDVVLGYDAAEEIAVHAICVMLLRQLAVGLPSDELLTGRAHVAEVVEQGLAFAPVGAGVEARVS